MFAYGVVSCAQVYIVRGCEFSMEQRATKRVGSGRTKQLQIPPVYSLSGIRAYDELQIVVTEVRQVRQTVTTHSVINASQITDEISTNHRNVLLLVPHHKHNSVALVRERTIPTERPPPVGEVSANFCG